MITDIHHLRAQACELVPSALRISHLLLYERDSSYTSRLKSGQQREEKMISGSNSLRCNLSVCLYPPRKLEFSTRAEMILWRVCSMFLFGNTVWNSKLEDVEKARERLLDFQKLCR